jgi:LeuA allosteric (dimerisation) domain.
MTLADIWQLFRTLYIRYQTTEWPLLDYRSESLQDGGISLHARIQTAEGIVQLNGKGNGLLSAAADALKSHFRIAFAIEDYHEHTLGRHSESRSAAYICCTFADGESRWGVCINNDVARASLQALLNALPLYSRD